MKVKLYDLFGQSVNYMLIHFHFSRGRHNHPIFNPIDESDPLDA